MTKPFPVFKKPWTVLVSYNRRYQTEVSVTSTCSILGGISSSPLHVFEYELPCLKSILHVVPIAAVDSVHSRACIRLCSCSLPSPCCNDDIYSWENTGAVHFKCCSLFSEVLTKIKFLLALVLICTQELPSEAAT
jgi:hypothetical protein